MIRQTSMALIVPLNESGAMRKFEYSDVYMARLPAFPYGVYGTYSTSDSSQIPMMPDTPSRPVTTVWVLYPSCGVMPPKLVTTQK